MSLVGVLVDEGLVEDFEEMECVICTRDFMETAPEFVTWRSVHPCMHWMCDECKKNWIDKRKQGWCPVVDCKQPILFTRPKSVRAV